MKFCALSSLLALTLLGAGCTDPAMEEPLPPAPPVPASAVDFQAQAGAVAELGVQPSHSLPMGGVDPANPLPESVATEQTLQTLNMLLLEYQAGGGRLPATMEELVSQKIVPRVPPAPAGKKFTVDPVRAMVSFAEI